MTEHSRSRSRPRAAWGAAVAALLVAFACGRSTPDAPPPGPPPSILLVTLDTTRADAIGHGSARAETPAFDALARRGRLFRAAYATAPETLPSHSSIMTGLYPGGHGVHENGRRLADAHAVLAERLQQAGYQTAAFVSSFVLDRRFGLSRGFERYDDEMPDGVAERSAGATTDRALTYHRTPSSSPRRVWVHNIDPHAPYAPPEPYRTRDAGDPYHREVAAMDAELRRLIGAFDATAPGPRAIIVLADHGEGLGDHGEQQHGNLLYQSTMHVPLVIAGPGVEPGVTDSPVSTRRIFQTVLDWAGIDNTDSLRGGGPEVVLGEAMKPYLS
jgi:arylsulfatase A-like enzyme